MLPPLERKQDFVRVFDFFFSFEEFFAPRFACTLGTLIDDVANSETVIAGSFGAVSGKLVTCLARLKELTFEGPVLTR